MRRAIDFTVCAALAACGVQEAGVPEVAVGAAVMPGPGPLRRGFDAAARNDDCVACHDEIAAEWQGSLHREAFTVREFQHALRREPMPFCRGCHAPEADVRRPEPALAAIGVACVSCHVPAGEAVLSARPADAPLAAPHAVVRDPAFAGPAACAGCHEFAFPDRRPVPEFMQTTIREHAAGPHREESCADCHMPRAADGRRMHGFAGSRDADWMRSVVTVSARRSAAARVEVTLDLDEQYVGHSFPTGDMMRRLAITVEVADRGAERRQRRFLARHWTTTRVDRGLPVRVETRDDRLGVDEGPRLLVFELTAEDAGRPIRWRVDYERVEAFAGSDEDGAVVVGRVELGGGSLLPLPGA
jgi:hypothetical protein